MLYIYNYQSIKPIKIRKDLNDKVFSRQHNIFLSVLINETLNIVPKAGVTKCHELYLAHRQKIYFLIH